MAKPGGGDVVGPFRHRVDDDDEAREAYDRLRRRVLGAMPYGLYVVGSADGHGGRNLMTANWVTQVSFDPKLIGVGVEHGSRTHELITAGGCFALSFVDREDRAVVRRFTKPVDADPLTGELNGFAVTTAVTGAPVLALAAAYVDCRVHDAPEFGGHTFFVGEVVDAAFTGDEDRPLLRMEDTRMSYGG